MSTLKQLAQKVLNEKNLKLLPENIKKDLQIFNVIGSLKEGGSGDVKLFESIEEMNQSTGNQDGDLAIVYNSLIQGVTSNSQFEDCIFPMNVTLPEEITSEISGTLRSINSWLDCHVALSPSYFILDGWGDSGPIRKNYESSDGIHYVRQDIEDVLNFGSTVTFEEYNSNFGYFMQTGTINYAGIYEFINDKWILMKTNLTATKEDVLGKTFQGANGIEQGMLDQTTDLTLNQLKTRTKIYDNLNYLSLGENVNNASNMFTYGNVKYIPSLNLGNASELNYAFAYSENICEIGNLIGTNIINCYRTFETCPNLRTIGEFQFNNVRNMQFSFNGCPNLTEQSLYNIANCIPISSQLNNSLVSGAIGLEPDRFNSNAKNILFNKGYLDCDQNIQGWATNYIVIDDNGVHEFKRGNVGSDEYDRHGIYLMSNIRYGYNGINNNSINMTISSNNGTDNGILLSMSGIFQGVRNASNFNIQINTSNVIYTDYAFCSCYNLVNAPNFDTSNVRSAHNMFLYCNKLQNVPNYNTINVVNMNGMFSSCKVFNNVPNFNTSNVEDMSNMFYNCNLKSVPNLNMSNVVSTYGMFSWMNSLNDVTNIINLPNIKNADEMFGYCRYLVNSPMLNLDNAENISLGKLFIDCRNLSNFSNVSNYNTTNVTNMSGMFWGCRNMTIAPNFDTSNVVDATNMFDDCYNLIEIPNFNFINLKRAVFMFSNCINITSNIPNFNLTNLISGHSMFYNCPNISGNANFEMPNLISCYGMFSGCSKVTSINIFNSNKCSTFTSAMAGCTNLISSDIDISNAVDTSVMFGTCINLVTVNLHVNNSTSKLLNMSRMFSGCNNLSDASIQNIINAFLNIHEINETYKSLSISNDYSPFYNTNIVNTRYQNRWNELTAAGWTF